MSTPICPYEPIRPWPWNMSSGEWLPGGGSTRPAGWGVPSGADNYTIAAARRCPWLYDASHRESSYGCADGSACRGYSCCRQHGGRALCPPSQPNMCSANSGCGGSYCCEFGDCRRRGGLRACPAPPDQPTGRVLQASHKERVRRDNGCVTRGGLHWLGFSGTRHGNLNFLGWVALSMFILLALGGLETVRRNFFELFYKSHLVGHPLGVARTPLHLSPLSLYRPKAPADCCIGLPDPPVLGK